MGVLLKGVQSVLIALAVIAIIGTGVILYYNTVKPEDEETAAIETQAETESTEQPAAETETDAASETEDETEPTESYLSGDTSSSVFSAENGHEHTYTTTVLRPATCTQAGEMKYTCYCGDSYVDSIPVLDHTPGQWITVRSATTSQTGLRQKSCTVCGRVIEEETLPMLAAPTTTSTEEKEDKDKDKDKNSTNDHKHTYTYEITEEASCTEKGEKTYTCTTCGSTFTTSIPATNHPSRKTVRTEGNCANPGKIEVTCSICDAVISSETLYYEHNWRSWETTTAATTTSEGVRTRTCRECGETQTKSIARLPGGNNSNSNNNNNNNGTSGGNNNNNNGNNNNNNGNNNNNNGNNNNNNGSSSGNNNNNGSSTSDHNHTYTSSVTTQPTCLDPGVTTYRCSCGDTYTENTPEALGHRSNEMWTITKKATVSEEGERVQYCSRCGAVAVSETIAKLEDVHTHSFPNPVVTREATCTSSGTRRHTCSCGYYYTSTIPALGHTASTSWETLVEATENSSGTEVRKCIRCKIVMETRTIPRLPSTTTP